MDRAELGYLRKLTSQLGAELRRQVLEAVPQAMREKLQSLAEAERRARDRKLSERSTKAPSSDR